MSPPTTPHCLLACYLCAIMEYSIDLNWTVICEYGKACLYLFVIAHCTPSDVSHACRRLDVTHRPSRSCTYYWNCSVSLLPMSTEHYDKDRLKYSDYTSLGWVRYRGSIPSSLLYVAAWRRPRGCCRTFAACSGGGPRRAPTPSSSCPVSICTWWRICCVQIGQAQITNTSKHYKSYNTKYYWHFIQDYYKKLIRHNVNPPLPARSPPAAPHWPPSVTEQVTSSRLHNASVVHQCGRTETIKYMLTFELLQKSYQFKLC